MATVLDTAILVGNETNYGSAAPLTRAFEGHADDWKRESEYLGANGFRGGYQTHAYDRRAQIDMGGSGSLEVDVLNKGLGLLLKGWLGTTATAQQGGTSAYKHTFATDTAEASVSYTVQVQRSDAGGSLRFFTHQGATITGWTLKNDVGGLLMANMSFDVEEVETSTASAAPAYPASAAPFAWTQGVASINSVATDIKSFELTADLGLKTDRRYIKGSPKKSQPVRSKKPEFTGSVTVDFEDNTLYDLWVAGTIVPITLTYTGSLIESSYYYEFKVTLPACQITGDAPQAQLEEFTQQTVPFKVLDNGTDDAITIEYTTTDTTP